MRKNIVWGILIVIVLGVLFLPLVDKTPTTTRVIVDYTNKEIVHPNCYDQASLTNWIDEVSFGRAVNDLEFEVRDSSSQKLLETGKTNIFTRIRSEEHTTELQSRFDLVCRLLL